MYIYISFLKGWGGSDLIILFSRLYYLVMMIFQTDAWIHSQ